MFGSDRYLIYILPVAYFFKFLINKKIEKLTFYIIIITILQYLKLYSESSILFYEFVLRIIYI